MRCSERRHHAAVAIAIVAAVAELGSWGGSDQGSQESDGPYPIRNHLGEEWLYTDAGWSPLV